MKFLASIFLKTWAKLRSDQSDLSLAQVFFKDDKQRTSFASNTLKKYYYCACRIIGLWSLSDNEGSFLSILDLHYF